jgi:L-ascorbate metabolism protein UlaG (beta-lactamase superfamily)
MKAIKHEHACLEIKINGRILVIDPGIHSTSFTPTNNIDVAIVTHKHSDHFDSEKIAAICSLNPNVVIFTTKQVSDQVPGAKVPGLDEKVTVGNFVMQFFGRDHATVIDGIIPCDNLGVVINDMLVYPGDSFSLPTTIHPGMILATPVSAPWLKVSEVINYINEVKPAKVFPTHNALLSEIGQSITYDWVQKTCNEIGTKFIDLKPDEELILI